MSEPMVESSGNIFTDLGFEPGEAAILQMRAKLFADLRGRLLSGALSEAEAAEKLQIGPGRVSDLVSGKWDKFSLETLIILESRAGRSITLEFAA